jgi:hypothetical protein
MVMQRNPRKKAASRGFGKGPILFENIPRSRPAPFGATASDTGEDCDSLGSYTALRGSLFVRFQASPGRRPPEVCRESD